MLRARARRGARRPASCRSRRRSRSPSGTPAMQRVARVLVDEPQPRRLRGEPAEAVPVAVELAADELGELRPGVVAVGGGVDADEAVAVPDPVQQRRPPVGGPAAPRRWSCSRPGRRSARGCRAPRGGVGGVVDDELRAVEGVQPRGAGLDRRRVREPVRLGEHQHADRVGRLLCGDGDRRQEQRGGGEHAGEPARAEGPHVRVIRGACDISCRWHSVSSQESTAPRRPPRSCSSTPPPARWSPRPRVPRGARLRRRPRDAPAGLGARAQGRAGRDGARRRGRGDRDRRAAARPGRARRAPASPCAPPCSGTTCAARRTPPPWSRRSAPTPGPSARAASRSPPTP